MRLLRLLADGFVSVPGKPAEKRPQPHYAVTPFGKTVLEGEEVPNMHALTNRSTDGNNIFDEQSKGGFFRRQVLEWVERDFLREMKFFQTTLPQTSHLPHGFVVFDQRNNSGCPNPSKANPVLEDLGTCSSRRRATSNHNFVVIPVYRVCVPFPLAST
ncbi:uncharacterized protein ZHAS_00017530 [Anopheles sinensis]|uniref:Uncharacterized protein n=1 Tax=Anopheles sinensis TaxID=74873 RepID=A0A084WGT3_ANOSI|nr:uncharacterized protein ZHAS_00017530 [Anopheles sinensis]